MVIGNNTLSVMNIIKYWLIDSYYAFKGRVAVVLYRRPPKHYLGYILENKIPVILIPGIGTKWAYLKKLGDRISLEGHAVYIVTKLGMNFIDIPKSAGIVREFVDEKNIKNGIILAHSKGGLIGKYFLIHQNKDNHILGMISIATPYVGAKLAKIVPLKPFKELTPASKIIQDLQSNTTINKKIISIFPAFDNFVSQDKQLLYGAENIVVKVKGHNKVLFSSETEDLVVKSLEKMSITNKFKL